MRRPPHAGALELAALAERLLAAARREDWDAVVAGLPALTRANVALEGDVLAGHPRDGLARLRRDIEALRACAAGRRAVLAESLRANRGRQRALFAYVQHD